MLKIGTIGFGGCGNAISKLASLEDFKSIAVNSSIADLETVGDICSTISLSDNGCGKDPKLAKKLMKEKYKPFVQQVKETFESFDVVVVTGSTGGGTAAGAMPIATDILRSSVKGITFIMAVVMPTIAESAKAQANTIQCLEEIKNLDVPYICYDNGTLQDKPVNQIYDTVNESIIQDLKILRGDYCPSSAYGNMDDRDRLKILSTKGLMSVNKVTGIKETYLDKESLGQIINRSISQSYNVDIERDKVVKRMGFIHSLNENILGQLDRSYSDISEQYGEPLEVFEHINDVSNVTDNGIITIISGLSHPETRLGEMSEKINSRKSSLTVKKESNLSQMKADISWMDDDDSAIIDDENKEGSEDLSDIFSKY